MNFWKQCKKKNSEKDYYNDPRLPSIGVEIEYVTYKGSSWNLVQERESKLNIDPQFGTFYGAGAENDKIFQLNTQGISKNSFSPQREGSGENTVINEVAMEPTASPKTQLREILQLMRTGVISNKRVTLHINIGELVLNTQHLEPMVITSILAGCDYKDRTFSQEQVEEVKKRGEFKFTQQERYMKLSYEEGAYYYPFHRFRNSKIYKQPYHYEKPNSVEFRGLTRFSNFSGMVRTVESCFWLSTAAKAYQEHKTTPTNQTKELAKVWESLNTQWLELLSTYGIKLEIDDSIEKATNQYIDANGGDVYPFLYDYNIDTPYNRALAKINYLAQTDEEFRTKTRQIVIKARKQAKQITKKQTEQSANEPELIKF